MTNYRDDKIRAAMGSQRLSITDLAEKTGLSRATVGPICDGKAQDPKSSTLKAIADALGIPLPELFEPRAERVEA